MGGREDRDRVEGREIPCVRPQRSDLAGERLRLAAAMAHVVPGLELTLWSAGEVVLTLGGHPARGDVDPCAFRAMVLGSGSVGGRLAAVDEVTAGGRGLSEVGGDVVARHDAAGLRWWWPSALGPDRIAEVLVAAGDERLGRGGLDADLLAAADARVRVDSELGVAVVGLEVPAPAATRRVGDDLALELWSACVVAELLG